MPKKSVYEILKEGRGRAPKLTPQKLRRLLARVLEKTPHFLFMHPEHLVQGKEREVFLEDVHAVSQGMPLTRLLGARDFWKHTFQLNEDTLDPRPDSEALIESVLEEYPDQSSSLRFLDLGTGTGCLLISLLYEYPQATGIGVDISAGALEAAQKNAHALLGDARAHFIQSSWFEKVEGVYDVILSNPPYITEHEFEGLERRVKEYDPKRALVSGNTGLECYQHILKGAGAFLTEGGRLFFELGYGQKDDLVREGLKEGFQEVSCKRDLSGIERCLVFEKKSCLQG